MLSALMTKRHMLTRLLALGTGWRVLAIFGTKAQAEHARAAAPPATVTVEGFHPHTWVQGPFYLKAAVTYEEPAFYPPNGLVRVEHCQECGLLRLPQELRGYDGENMHAGKLEGD